MKVNVAVCVRLARETTFLPMLAGLLAIAGGLGLFEASLGNQCFGVSGALIIALVTHRPLDQIRVGLGTLNGLGIRHRFHSTDPRRSPDRYPPLQGRAGRLEAR